MHIIVEGHQIDIGQALQTYVTESLTDLCAKFFDHTISGDVTFQPEKHGYHKCDITVSVGNGIVLKASDTEGDIYKAYDRAADKIKKQLRRYKARLRDHHRRVQDQQPDQLAAAAYVLQPEPEDQELQAQADDKGLIIAETQTVIETLSVSDAVMRMDLADVNAYMFRNSKTNQLSVVYRRKDGHIGWIDPSNFAEAEKAA